MKNRHILYFLLLIFTSLFSYTPLFSQGAGSAVRLNGGYLQSGEDDNVAGSTENLRMEGWFKFDNTDNAAYLLSIANDLSASGAPAFPETATTYPFRVQKGLWWSGGTGMGVLNVPAGHLVLTVRDESGLFNNANGCGLVSEFRGRLFSFHFPITLQSNYWYHISATISNATPAANNIQVQLFVNGIALTSNANVIETLPSGTGGGPCPTIIANTPLTPPLTAPSINLGTGTKAFTLGTSGDIETNIFVGTYPDGVVTTGIADLPFRGLVDQVRIENNLRSETNIRDLMCNNQITNMITYTFDDDPATATAINSGGNPFVTTGYDDTGSLTVKMPIRPFGTVTQELSSAPIGNVSTYVYGGTTTPGFSYVGISGNVSVTATVAPTVMHIYRVDASPNNVTLPAPMGNIDTRYFGVFTGTNNSTYSITYTYGASTSPNPPLPANPLALAIARRNNNAAGAFNYDMSGVATATTHTLSGLTFSALNPANQQEFIYGALPIPDVGPKDTPAPGLGTLAYSEGAGDPSTNPTSIITNTVTVTGTNITSGTVQFTAGFVAGDVLAATVPMGFTASFSGTTLTITGTGTPAQYQTIFRSVTFRHTTDNPTNATRTVRFAVANGSLNSINNPTANITVTPINDPPVISGVTGAVTYVKLDPAINVLPSIGLTDPDDTQLTQAVVTITNFTGAQDQFRFAVPLPAGITSAQVDMTGLVTAGTVTFNGTAAIGTYRALLASLTYRNTSATPAPATRVVAVQVTDNGSGGTLGTQNSNNPSVTINIDATFNIAPTFDAGCNTGTTRTFTEGDANTTLLTAATVSDQDGTNLSKAEIKITTGYQNGQDELFNDGMLPGALAFTWDAMTGTYTLNGVATIADYQAAVQLVKYRNTNVNNPIGGNRTITVQFFDNGFPNGNPANIKSTALCSFTLNVVPVNTPPTLADIGTGAVTYTESQLALLNLVDQMGVTITDLDNTTMASATAQITTNYLSNQDELFLSPAVAGLGVSWNSALGTLTISGTASIATYQAAFRNIRYRNNSQNPNLATRTVSFRVNDGQPTNNLNIAIPTRDINITPVNNAPVLANMETTILQYTEGDGVRAITSNISVGDVDNTNQVSATVTIGAGFVTGQDVLAFTNQAGIIGNWDAMTGILTLTGASSLANYQTALRSITYTNTSQNPTAGSRTISFVTNDGAVVAPTNLNSNLVARQINVIPVNNPPAINNTHGAQTYTENESPKSIFLNPNAANLTIIDVDNATLSSATLRITGNYFANQDVLAFTNTANITGTWNRTTGTLTLVGITSLANYRDAILSVTYANSSETPSPLQRMVSITVNDGAANSNTVPQLINVTPVNDIPTIANFTRRTNVNGSLLILSEPFLQTYSDIEGDAMRSIRIASLPTRGTLSFNGLPVAVNQVIPLGDILLNYRPNEDFEGNDSFQWQAFDGTDFSASARVNIEVRLTDLYPPDKLKVQAGSRQVLLSWDPVVVEGVTVEYEIYILSANQPLTFVAKTNEEKFLITGLQNTITYSFRVLALDNLGRRSSLSEPISARPSIVLGTEDDLANLQLALFPNPNTGNFVIQFVEKASKKAQIYITNALGQQVYQKEIQSNAGRFEEKIEVQLLTEGSYILQISTDKNTYQKRFVVQK